MIVFGNILIIALFASFAAYMYNKYTDFFVAMLIIIIYWIQLLVSSAYIETGVYLKDIGVTSYATGVTIRLGLQIILMLSVIMFWARRWYFQITSSYVEIGEGYNCKKWNIGLFIVYLYRLIDILLSGNILTNPNVTRFNYFTEISKLPFAQIVDYFSYPLLWIARYNLIHAKEKRQRIIPVLVFAMNIFSLLLRGIQFGGILQCLVYFGSPCLLLLARRKKLLKLRNVVLAAVLLVVILIPKYNHFSDLIKENKADTSYGLFTAYDFLVYRMFAQEADLTWEIDRQVVEEKRIDPGQFVTELLSLVNDNMQENAGTQYLMNRACSLNALSIYSRGTAVVTGGYPVIWAAMFGYLGAIPFWILDASLLAVVLRCICISIKQRRLMRLLGAAYILCQCYTIVLSANLGIMGNTIPKILIVFLLCTERRILVFKLKNKEIRI